ncbi:MAG: sigma-E processing peptidase SpoIIGA, partial [Oscillospiraceae bacterium]
MAETMEATFSVEKDVYIKVQAFYDTGFALKDVINNKDVILVDYKKVKDRLPENLQETLERYFLKGITQTDEKVTPIFFSTISGDGSLPGIKALDVKINNKSIDNVMLAFSQNALTENVNAIFGSDIKK